VAAVFAVLSGLAVLGFAPPVQAAEESAETEALLRKGIQLRREGADEAALAVFLEAHSQSPESVRVLLHVATAAQAASKWLMADEYLRKAAEHSDDPYYQRYRTEIEEVRAATAQRVGQFRAVGEPEGAQVILNGQVVGTLPMETPKNLEAGTYVLEVTKPGFYRLRRPIAVPGSVLTRETVALNPRAAGSSDDLGSTGNGVGVDTRTGEPPAWWSQPWVSWTLLGVGVAGGATSGIGFYLRERAVDKWNDEGRCLNPSQPDLPRSQVCSDTRNDIDVGEQVAVIGGVVGVAFAGAALTHWLATSGDDEPDAASSALGARKSARSLSCSPGVLNLVCSGSF
jgi:hypothetical protein